MTPSSPNGMPGMGPMTDTLDFVKKLWGGMSVPGMVVPTMSVDELQQKITDLKTVESWLNLNLTMLRNTIQTMEIQRATLATIQSVGAAMGAAMKPGEDGKPAFPFPFSAGNATSASADSGTNPFSYPNWPAPAPKPGSASSTQAASGNASASDASGKPTTGSTPAADGKAGIPNETGAGAAGATDFAAAMAVPNAWWNMLQNQFMQAVGQAMADGSAAVSSAVPPSSSATGEGGSERGESGKGGRSTKSTGDGSSEAKPARKPKA